MRNKVFLQWPPPWGPRSRRVPGGCVRAGSSPAPCCSQFYRCYCHLTLSPTISKMMHGVHRQYWLCDISGGAVGCSSLLPSCGRGDCSQTLPVVTVPRELLPTYGFACTLGDLLGRGLYKQGHWVKGCGPNSFHVGYSNLHSQA